MHFRLSKSTRRTYGAILFLGLSVALVFWGYSAANKKFVPDRFTQARQNSAGIAKEIVGFTEASLVNLEQIAKEDQGYRFKNALALVQEELARGRQARLKAMELTGELDAMARSALEIKPKSARDLAIAAISHELSLISRLIVYNDTLNGLFQTLELKFTGDIRYDTLEVQSLVKNLNQQAREINNLNELFNEKMRELDQIAGNKT